MLDRDFSLVWHETGSEKKGLLKAESISSATYKVRSIIKSMRTG